MYKVPMDAFESSEGSDEESEEGSSGGEEEDKGQSQEPLRPGEMHYYTLPPNSQSKHGLLQAMVIKISGFSDSPTSLFEVLCAGGQCFEVLINTCLSYKHWTRVMSKEFELCQRTRHTASTTFLWQIKLATDRPIGTCLMIFIVEIFF